MTTVKDDWLMAAMSDDLVVAELLIRLKQSQPASPSAKSQILPAPLLPFSWGTKQSRSRITSASRCDAVLFSRKKESDSTRRSPTTPLSWSGGASPSATADCCEESSQPTSAARSKVLSHSLFINRSLYSNLHLLLYIALTGGVGVSAI